MSNERLKYEGRLAVMEKDARKLKVQLKGLVESLRDQLDPTEDVRDLDAEVIASQGVEFASKHTEYIELLAKIKEVNKILGRG
nr:hypothetical protein 14 [bacterium]